MIAHAGSPRVPDRSGNGHTGHNDTRQVDPSTGLPDMRGDASREIDRSIADIEQLSLSSRREKATRPDASTTSSSSSFSSSARNSNNDSHAMHASGKPVPAATEAEGQTGNGFRCLISGDMHEDIVVAVALDGAGSIVSASRDGAVRLWDLQTRDVGTIAYDRGVLCLHLDGGVGGNRNGTLVL